MDLFLKIVNSLGGVSLFFTAIVSYLAKLYFEKYKSQQELMNRELQAKIDAANSLLRSKHERSVYVTKSQFDKEFSSYSSIWGAVFSLKEDVLCLRPILDQTNLNESFEERKNKRLSKFIESFNFLVIQVESNKPFIPVDVYNRIDSFRTECRKESISYEYGDPFGEFKEYWGEAEENRIKIMDLFNEVCESIRQRLHVLSVIE